MFYANVANFLLTNLFIESYPLLFLESSTSGHRKGRTSTALPKTNFTMADNLLQRLSNRFIWNLTHLITYSQPNLVSSCPVSRSPADKQSQYPHPLLARKDKLSLSFVFQEFAVSLSLSYISMVFLAFRSLFLVIGIFCVCILLSKSPLSGSI